MKCIKVNLAYNITQVVVKLIKGGYILFIRTERSIKEFMYAYPIVSTLIIINIALWIFTHFLTFDFSRKLLFFGVGHNYSIYSSGEYWRLVTPIFLHADLMHTLFNSFSLVIFGPALEQMLGKNKFMIGYLLAGIAGNIGTYLVNPMSMTTHVGASGAIYGLFGFYIFMVLFRKHLIDPGNAQIVLTIFIIGLVLTFITPRININAHVFGFLGGLALAPVLLKGAKPFSIYRNRRPRDKGSIQFDPNRWRKRRIPRQLKINIMWIIIGTLVVLGILGRIL